MSYAARVLGTGLRRVLGAQVILALLAGAGAVWTGTPPLPRFGAALAGGAVAMLGTLLLAYTVMRADARAGAAQAQLWLYGGAAARFLLAIVLLGVGLGVLGLPPLPFLAGFGVGQVAFLVPGISSGL